MARKKLTDEEKELIRKKKLEEGIKQGRKPISENISENNRLEDMFKIFQEHNIKPVDENKTPQRDRQRFIEYYNNKLSEPERKELDGLYESLRYSANNEKIKENIKKYEEKQTKNAIDAAKYGVNSSIKNILYGTGKGISDSGAGLLGLITNIPGAVYNKAKDPENVSFLEEISKDNFWFNQQKDFDNLLKETLDVEDAWETGNKEDKTQQFIGEFLMPLGKLKKVMTSKSLQKALKITPEQAENALNYVIPGPQITKGASKGKQLMEIATQTPVALGLEETLSAINNQEGIIGDYSDKKDIKKYELIDDKRSIGKNLFMDELDPKIIRLIELDRAPQKTWRDYSPFHNKSGEVNTLGYATGITGGLLVSSKVTRALKNLKQKKIEKVIQENELEDAIDILSKDLKQNETKTITNILNKEPSNVRHQMSVTERLDNSLADKMNFIDNMKKRNQLSKDALYEVSRDIYSQIDSKFNTGILSDTVKTNVSPLITKQKILQLKANQPEYYNKLERLLEISSIVQDETNRVNKFKLNRAVDMSPDDYLIARGSNKLTIDESINYRSTKNLLNLQKEHTDLLQELRSIPQTATLIEEISDISKQMLKVLEESGMYSKRSIDLIKKNRTFNGLMSYKPRKPVINETFSQKVKNALFTKQDDLINNKDIINSRTEGSIGIGQNYSDLLESDIKNTLLEIHYNNITKKFVDDALPKQNKNLNEVLDKNIDNKLKILSRSLSKEDLGYELAHNDLKTVKQVNDIMKIRPLGVEDIDNLFTHDKPKSFFDIINREQHTESWLNNTLNQTFGETEDKFLKASKNYRNRSDVISYIHDGKIHYYQVDPIIAKGFNSNPELPGLIGRGIRTFRNFRQQTITGSLNPLFTIPSATYTTEESLVALGKIADELNKALDAKTISRKEYLKEIKTAYNEIKAQNQSKKLLNNFTEEYIKNFGKSDNLLDQKMFETTQKQLQDNINSSLLTKIQLAGGSSSKPFNTNSGIYYNLNKDTVLSDAIKTKIYQNNTVNNANKLINAIDYTQTALREAPNLGLVQYLGKKYGAIVGDEIVDQKKFDKILNTTNKYIATMGKKGSHLGVIGKLGKFAEDYIHYGHVSIQSLAPKLRGLRVGDNLNELVRNVKYMYDPNISYSDIFSNLERQINASFGDKYVQSFIAASVIPSMMSYVWNYSSQENADAYHGIDDYTKATKFVLVNAFGKGKHLTIPVEQELGVGNALTYNLLDSMIGMSGINQNDPAFDSNKLVLTALSRSLFVDEVAGTDIASAIMGKKVNINPLDDRAGIKDLTKNRLNSDLSETAYENGVLNNYTINIINTIFGTLGKTLTNAIEEGNVGLRDSVLTGINDANQAALSSLFHSGKLFTDKFNTYNETSQYVYNKINTIQKIQDVSKSFNPIQNEVYSLIKSYRNNRINPIHQQITQLQRIRQHIKANGYVDGEKISLDYSGRKIKMQDIDRAMAKLFVMEYEEYKDLDKIIEQEFGKGINLENFVTELGDK